MSKCRYCKQDINWRQETNDDGSLGRWIALSERGESHWSICGDNTYIPKYKKADVVMMDKVFNVPTKGLYKIIYLYDQTNYTGRPTYRLANIKTKEVFTMKCVHADYHATDTSNGLAAALFI